MARGMVQLNLSLAAVALLLLLTPPAVTSLRSPDWTWRTGRATFYGGPGDPWSIHDGSCEYYYLDPNVATGWDVTAPADQAWDFDGMGGCGGCYEVACNPISFTDGYQNAFDRTNVCYDSAASLIVQITDSCPCTYATNQYSNKRWCCGDMYHMDLSIYAFEKLADRKWGVMGIKYRRVDCSYQPSNQATLPSGQSPTGPSRDPPSGWDSSMDKRPRIAYGSLTSSSAANSWTSLYRTVVSASNPSDSPSSSGSGSPSSSGGASSSSSGSGSPSSSGYSSTPGGSTNWIVRTTIQSGWTDLSYKTNTWTMQQGSTPDGSTPYCTTVNAEGGLSFQTTAGAFNNLKVIKFQVKKNDYGIPDFNLQILGPKGVCQGVNMPGVKWILDISGSSDWLYFSVPLNAFSWQSDWSSNAATFRGCGSGSLGSGDVTTMQIANNRASNQWICLNNLQLA